jgi:hypothetical protein
MQSVDGNCNKDGIGNRIESDETGASATAGVLLPANKARLQQQESLGPIGHWNGALATLGARLLSAWC